MDEDQAAPLLDPLGVELLRIALSDYTVDGVQAEIGLVGESALRRADLLGVERLTRGGSRLAVLIRLFMLGLPVDERRGAAALTPLPVEAGVAAGLLERCGGEVRSLLDVRPYAEPADAMGIGADVSWWVISDFGSDVRPGPVRADHVLGIGPASLTLAQATVRPRVHSAADIGTGCGVQALHLSRHVGTVTVTDISSRALRLSATTAALNGLSWQLRRGSLLEPVADGRFDLVVSNPPFVVSPGYRTDSGGLDYRDSGLAGDGVCRALVRGLPHILTEGGTAQLLANWVIDRDTPWDERLGDWFVDGPPVTAWVWQREVAEPGEYVAMWLRDAGLDPQTPDYQRRYDEWLSWFAVNGVAGIGMGVISMRRTDGATDLVCEDVRQPILPGAGAEVDDWFARRAWLTSISDDMLVRSRLRAADGLVLSAHSELSDGWQQRFQMVRQSSGLRWEVEADDAMARLLAGCTGSVDLAVPITLLAADLAVSAAELRQAVLPVVRNLVGRGFLQPVLEST